MAKYKVVVLENDHADNRHVMDSFSDFPDAEIIEANVNPKKEEEIIEAVRDADAVLFQWSRITEKVIDAMEHCKVLSFFGISVDGIDVEAATKKGIIVCNNLAYNKIEVAMHNFSLILALMRQLFQWDHLIRSGNYGRTYLKGELRRPETQTLGLFSYGKISRKVASMCREALDMNVIFYDPFLDDNAGADTGARKVDFETLLAESDVISVNGPLTKENFHIFDKDAFSKMKPTAYIVNCARGALVDTEALVDALKNRVIAGAGIDVHETEPLPGDHPLTALDNVILTPHVAWYTREAMYDEGYYAGIQAKQVLKGEYPMFPVNAKELGLKK